MCNKDEMHIQSSEIVQTVHFASMSASDKFYGSKTCNVRNVIASLVGQRKDETANKLEHDFICQRTITNVS